MAFSGCGPKNPVTDKPLITICGLDIPASLGNCGRTGQKDKTTSSPVPLAKLDKFIAMSVDDYISMKNYQDKLEIYVQYMDKKYKN